MILDFSENEPETFLQKSDFSALFFYKQLYFESKG